jgi:hypothetical protein
MLMQMQTLFYTIASICLDVLITTHCTRVKIITNMSCRIKNNRAFFIFSLGKIHSCSKLLWINSILIGGLFLFSSSQQNNLSNKVGPIHISREPGRTTDPLRLVCYLACTKAAIRPMSWASRIVGGRSRAGRCEGIARKRWEGGADEQEWERSVCWWKVAGMAMTLVRAKKTGGEQGFLQVGGTVWFGWPEIVGFSIGEQNSCV